MKTDILLVQPKYTDGRTEIRYHYGLGMLGASLKRKGYTIGYCDLNFDKLDISSTKTVGVTCWTMAYPQAKDIAEICNRHKIPCFAGGPHASADPKSLIDVGYSAVCVGEGEEVIIDIMEGQVGAIKGYIEDLDTLPMPDESLRHKYPYVNANHIFCTRGCPNYCIFCQQVMGHKVRTRSPEHILQEMRTHNHSIPLEILDDCITYDKEWLDRMSMAVHKNYQHPLYTLLSNGTRVDTIDDEVAGWLHNRLHVTNSMLGLESADPKVLKLNNKGITTEQFLTALEICSRNKITPGIFMIIGLAGATYESDLQSIEFVKNTGRWANWGVAFAFPNTALWNWVDRHGRWLCNPRDYGHPSSPQWDTVEYPAELRLKALQIAQDSNKR